MDHHKKPSEGTRSADDNVSNNAHYSNATAKTLQTTGTRRTAERGEISNQ
jgi:hypothetical protein